MREKIKRFREKISKKISSSPTHGKFLRMRDKLADRIKNALLACFSAIGPVWIFLFVKTPDPEAPSNEIRLDVI